MEINKNNYEAYFIDYLEGNLDELLVNDFIEFLQQNPNLKDELSLLETVSVAPENISFDKKEILYKEKLDAEKEFYKAAIANLEGDISTSGKMEFEKYVLNHPEKKRDIELFGKTKLQVDETIVFNNKKKLYHYSLTRNILLWTGRVAAILVIAFAFFTLIDKTEDKIIPDNTIVKFEDKKEKKTTTPVLKQKPVETKKKDPIKIKKSIADPTIKKAATKQKSNKSLRENPQGRITHEDIAMSRISIEVPSKMNGIMASLPINQPKVSLATMYITIPENYDNYYDDGLLVGVMKEKMGLNNFSFNKITKAGLNFVSSVSKEKFKYKTNKEGKITGYNYDSRLLAFSIPSKNVDSE